MGSELGEPACSRPADPARAAGHERDATRELPARRRLRQLVALERPVLDRERLRLTQRAEPARGVGGVLHLDRTVIEVAGEPGPTGIRAGGEDPDAGHEHDSRPGRINRERPTLVRQIALVVVPVPAGVLLDAAS